MARKSGRMAEEDLRAFDPIPFPALGPEATFNANFCRNPMCPNFGPAPDRDGYAERYRVDAYSNFLADKRYVCRVCSMSSRLLSNRSLRAAHAWFKRQSIPYKACGNPGCANEGVNVFQHWDRYRYDSARDAHKVRCRRRPQWTKCRSATYLGAALNLAGNLDEPGELERRMVWLFQHVRGGVTVSNVLGVFGVGDQRLTGDHYAAVLRNVANRIRDYQSYRNADFMAPGYPDRLDALFRAANEGAAPEDAAPKVSDNPFNGTAALQTDAMLVPIGPATSSYSGRERQVPVLVTALRLHKPASLFVLAVHPCAVFRDGDAMPGNPGAALADAMRPVAERRFDHLLHYGTDHGENALSGEKSSYLGGKALLMREEYAELAHFMVLKEQVLKEQEVEEPARGFARVTLTMDGKLSAYRSAAAVFAREIRTPCDGDAEGRRVEIALVQTVQTVRAGQRAGRQPPWDAQLRKVARAWRERTPEGLAGPDTEAKARLFRQVMSSARTDEGSWAWPRRRREKEMLAVLWLSQGPDREWPPRSETVKALLRYTSLQRVNTAIGTVRSHATYLERPEVRSGGGAKYVSAAGNIELLSCQAWLAWFTVNYGRIVKRTGGQRPADLVGVEHDVEPIVYDIAGRETLRLGWREAEEMTERLSDG